jgi:hypothetical protein
MKTNEELKIVCFIAYYHLKVVFIVVFTHLIVVFTTEIVLKFT